MTTKPETWIIDIDGCLCIHHQKGASYQWTAEMQIIEDSRIRLDWLEKASHHIVLMTARPEHMRQRLQYELHEKGIVYHQLVMGVTSGKRVLVNDMKPGGVRSAECINLERNKGLGSWRETE